ncbi:hypothetical protein C0J52_08135 [Blattella germanica]|nr:hypothetical protein C0J52_08135 [Blattella germanica]
MEIYDSFKDSSISTTIRLKGLQWIEHVIRMEKERVPLKILKNEFGGRRPRNRWLDVVERDIKQLGLRIWRRVALNRQE